MGTIPVIAKRELRGYFATPLAYVFIVIFLALTGWFTFYLGGFYERGQADLTPFFNFRYLQESLHLFVSIYIHQLLRRVRIRDGVNTI